MAQRPTRDVKQRHYDGGRRRHRRQARQVASFADAEANDLTQLPSTVRLTGTDATCDGLLARLAVARCLHLAYHGEVSGPKVSARHFYPPITMSDRLVDAVLSDERRVAGIEPPTVSIRLANGSLLDPAALRARRITTSIVGPRCLRYGRDCPARRPVTSFGGCLAGSSQQEPKRLSRPYGRLTTAVRLSAFSSPRCIQR